MLKRSVTKLPMSALGPCVHWDTVMSWPELPGGDGWSADSHACIRSLPQHAHAPSLPASSLPLLGMCTNVHCMYVARPVYQCTQVLTVLLACVYIPTLSKCTSRYRITLMHGFLAPQVEVPRDQSAAEMAMSPVASVSSHVDPYPHYIMAGASEYSLSCRWGRTSMQLS